MASKRIDIMEMVEVRWKGIYDFDGLYKTIRGWLDNRRYDYMETLYKDKMGGNFGNETEIKMTPELKVNEYVKFHIDIFIKIWDLKEFEANVDGKKKLVSDGRFWVQLTGWVELDYSENYTGKFAKGVQDFVVDKLLLRYFEFKYYDRLTKDVYDLQTEIKKFLKMETGYNSYT